MKLVTENARVSNRRQRTYGRNTHHKPPTNVLTGSVLKSKRVFSIYYAYYILLLHLRELTELGRVEGAGKSANEIRKSVKMKDGETHGCVPQSL